MPEIDLGSVVGPQGEQGVPGPAGAEGKQGPQGATGEAGKSAYQAARDGGYTGTEAEFNAILAIIDKHADRHKTGGADPLTAADVGAVNEAEFLFNAGIQSGVDIFAYIKECIAAGAKAGSFYADDSCTNLPTAHYYTISWFSGYNTIGVNIIANQFDPSYLAGRNCYFGSIWNGGVFRWHGPFATTDYALPRDGSEAMTGTLKIDATVTDALNVSGLGCIRKGEDGIFFLRYLGNNGDASNGYRALCIDGTINHSDSNVALSYEYFDADGRTGKYPILHTGNKPSGNYTGNGDATTRTIETGGIGDVIAIRGGGGASAIVSNAGAITWDTAGGFTALPYAEVNFASGVLTLATNSTKLNGSGGVYGYQVL